MSSTRSRIWETQVDSGRDDNGPQPQPAATLLGNPTAEDYGCRE